MIRTRRVEGVDVDGVLTLDLVRDNGDSVAETLDRILRNHHNRVRMILIFRDLRELFPGEWREIVMNIVSYPIVGSPVLVVGASEGMQAHIRQLMSGYCTYFKTVQEAHASLQRTEV